MPSGKNDAPDGAVSDPDIATNSVTCSVCRETQMCSFCTGDGYLMEMGDIHPCGVCGGTGVCQLCASQ